MENTVGIEEVLELKDPDQKKDETVIDSKSFLHNITLEPWWFGVMMPIAIEIVIFKNIYIERACLIDLQLPTNSCDMLAALDPDIEKNAQKIISSISVNSGIISGLISCVTVVFLGPWSDSSGRRKPLMLLSALSHIVSTVGVLSVLSLPNLSVAWIIYLKAIPLAFGGSLTMLSAYSYLGDICYKTKRCATLVMGRNGFFMYITFVSGCLVAPTLNKYIGFTGLAIFIIFLQIFSVIYVILRVKDVNVKKEPASMFDITLPLKAVQCILKRRQGYKRTIILCMLIIPAANSIIGANEMAMRYLYLRNAFSWSESDYGTLLTTRQTINSIGILLIVNVFKKLLKFKDETIGLIGGTSELIDAFVFMNINKNWMLYATALFGILSSGPITVERPIINKYINQYEQGKVYSVISILEIFFNFTTVPISNYIYSKTLAIFPSCFMLVSVFGSALTVLCYIYVIRLCTLETKRIKEIENKKNYLIQMVN